VPLCWDIEPLLKREGFEVIREVRAGEGREEGGVLFFKGNHATPSLNTGGGLWVGILTGRPGGEGRTDSLSIIRGLVPEVRGEGGEVWKHWPKVLFGGE